MHKTGLAQRAINSKAYGASGEEMAPIALDQVVQNRRNKHLHILLKAEVVILGVEISRIAGMFASVFATIGIIVASGRTPRLGATRFLGRANTMQAERRLV